MKKIIFTLFLMNIVLLLRADERSESLLRKMASTFNSYSSYSIEFTASMEGEFQALPGELIVSGEKYYLDVYDSEIFFDGKTGYTYSESNDEVIIETPDPNDNRLFANPSKIFQFYEQDFTSEHKGAAIIDGKRVSEVLLSPRNASAGYNHVTLYADASGLPVRVVYHLSEYGQDLLLDVLRIIPNKPVTDATFRFDPAQYPGVEIIDFR